MKALCSGVLLGFLAIAAVKEKAKPLPTGGITTPGIQIPFANLKPEAVIALDGPAQALLFAQNLLVSQGAKIARIDTKSNKTLEAWPTAEGLCGGMVNAFASLWAPTCGKNSILKIDTKSGKTTNTLEFGAQAGDQTIAASSDSIWAITDSKGTLSRLDPKEHNVVAEFRLSSACNALAYEAESIWATCPAENRVLRVNPKTNVVTDRIETAAEPIAMAFAEGTLFVLGKKEGKISKIDPKTNKVTGTIETKVNAANGTLAFGDGYLWVSQAGFPLTKIDVKNDKVMQQFYGEGAGTIKFAASALWLLPTGKAEIKRIDPKRVAVTLAE